MAKSLTLLTCHGAKFKWTPLHHTAFLMLKNVVTPAPTCATLIQQKDT